jgi:uracil phosphoribosyltransferase
MNKVILKAEDLDGYLTGADREYIARMDRVYRDVMSCFSILAAGRLDKEKQREEGNLIRLFNEMGSMMQEICKEETGLQVYSFLTPQESHPEASRVIAKLRDLRTGNEEFVYYIQRA